MSVRFAAVARTAAAAAEEKKARDVRTHPAGRSSGVADYFLLATVDSAPQMEAVAEEVDRRVKAAHGLDPLRRDGRGSAQWQVVDYGGVVVHLMTEAARTFYGLERLWEVGALPPARPRAPRRAPKSKPSARPARVP